MQRPASARYETSPTIDQHGNDIQMYRSRSATHDHDAAAEQRRFFGFGGTGITRIQQQAEAEQAEADGMALQALCVAYLLEAAKKGRRVFFRIAPRLRRYRLAFVAPKTAEESHVIEMQPEHGRIRVAVWPAAVGAACCGSMHPNNLAVESGVATFTLAAGDIHYGLAGLVRRLSGIEVP